MNKVHFDLVLFDFDYLIVLMVTWVQVQLVYLVLIILIVKLEHRNLPFGAGSAVIE